MSELTIGAVRAEDGGIYTCFARNEFGHDQTAMHLLVQGMYLDIDILESFFKECKPSYHDDCCVSVCACICMSNIFLRSW